MKTNNWVRALLLLLSVLLLAGSFVGCGGKDPKETGETGDPSAPQTLGNTATVTTGDTRLELKAGDNELTFTSFKTAGGKEELAGPSAFALPASAGLAKDAVNALNWHFEKAERVKGTENGHEIETVTFTYTDEAAGMTLRVNVVTRPTLPGPVEFNTTLENTSGADLYLMPGSFASVSCTNDGEAVLIKKESGIAEGYKHYDDTYFGGTGIYRKKVKETDYRQTVAWVTTSQGFNSSGYFPMIYFDRGDNGLYAALGWSSGRVLTTVKGEILTLSVDMDKFDDGGIGLFGDDFLTRVPAGDTFMIPPVYIGAYEGDLDDGSNVFKHWFFECKSPAVLRDNPMEPLTQMDMMTGYDNHTVESLKWDYGWWYPNATFPSPLEGSWSLRERWERLGDFGPHIKEMGINSTVYLLLHDSIDENGNPTDQYGEFNSVTHPDWFSNRLIHPDMGHSADLGNVECVEYLKETLTEFFTETQIATWRTDFEPIISFSNRVNRHINATDVMYWCTVGFKEVVDHLYAHVPGFRYESCSSGGSMKDLFTATLAISINNDDCANYLSLRTTFYDSSYVIHPTQLQEPTNCDFFNPDVETFYPVVTTTAPDSFDFRDTMLDMGFRSMMLGSPMFGSWTGKTVLDDYYRQYQALYAEKIRPLTREAELYHILPRPDGTNFDGVMYADPDSENEIKGLIFLFKPSEKPGNEVHVPIRGLDPNVTYQLTFEDRPEQNLSATGADLMQNGIDVTIEYVGSELIWITEAK